MKKIYKTITFILFVVLLIFVTNISLNAEDTIPDTDNEPIQEEVIEEDLEQPSELALWIEENIIKVGIGVVSGLSIFGISIWRIIVFIKKLLDKVKKERESTNEATNNSTISINETNNKIKDLLSLVGLQEEEIKTLKTEIRELIKSNKDQMEYNEKKLGTIIELLKIYISNNKEAVRTGVAETVNKLANEV